MYSKEINIKLKKPWKDKEFKTSQLGYLNFLVGPNGSGKSRFCEQLKGVLPKCRYLSSDRLAGLFYKSGGNSHLIFSQPGTSEGFNKSHFEHYKSGAIATGIGADAFVLLEEKFDLRIKVEATLTQIFSREIRLEWDSGKLVPKAYNITQEEVYDLHKEECHGIKELLVLLTHIYDDSHQSLIIDEPELNLHPQYQAFLIQEIRKNAGSPEEGKKVIAVVTHSPFILDILTPQDLKSTICFHSNFETPSHLFDFSEEEINSISSIIPRLNVHHKQLFFAETPVFVEGIFDSQFIKSIQEFRGVSMEGSGSCVIDVGGNTEIAHYHKLIEAYGKQAIYIYDLDSIFIRSLRTNADTDLKVKEFLAKIGAGDEFQKYCGDLEKSITKLVNDLKGKSSSDSNLLKLIEYIDKTLASSDKDKTKKTRVAFLVHLNKHRESLVNFFTEIKITAIEGKLNNIVSALKEQNVYLLKGGALEHYLPSYTSNIYQIDESKKKEALETELSKLFTDLTEPELASRYGYLYEVITKLPGNKKVDYLKPLKAHLGNVIFKIQQGVLQGLIKSKDTVPAYLGKEWESYSRVLTIENLSIGEGNKFSCLITIQDKWGIGELGIDITDKTNAGMGDFELIKK